MARAEIALSAVKGFGSEIFPAPPPPASRPPYSPVEEFRVPTHRHSQFPEHSSKTKTFPSVVSWTNDSLS